MWRVIIRARWFACCIKDLGIFFIHVLTHQQLLPRSLLRLSIHAKYACYCKCIIYQFIRAYNETAVCALHVCRPRCLLCDLWLYRFMALLKPLREFFRRRYILICYRRARYTRIRIQKLTDAYMADSLRPRDCSFTETSFTVSVYRYIRYKYTDTVAEL